MLDRTSLDYLPGETVGGRYNRLVQYAQTFDPRFVGGVASVPEVDRVEKVIATFKRQAEERAAEKQRNDPHNIVKGKLRELWQRAHGATQEIPQMQEKARPYRRAFKIIGLPENLFDPPAPHGIPEGPPYNWTVADFDACIAEATPKVAALEDHATKLKHHIAAWERQTSEQQIWQALSAIAERISK